MTKAPLTIKIIVGGAFMQNYNIYTHARNAAWRFLLDNDVKQLPIGLSHLCHNNNIILKLRMECRNKRRKWTAT